MGDSVTSTKIPTKAKNEIFSIEKIPVGAKMSVNEKLLIDQGRSEAKDESIPVVVCGISLNFLGRSGQFVATSCSIFFFFVVYGYLQEAIFASGNFKAYGWHLTLMQFFFYSIFGAIEQQFKKDGKRKIPLLTYAFLAFLTVTTMGCSNTSVGYLNYPTQVIFKCCKLIPVMIGGIFIQGKRYNIFDFFAVVLMTVGLIFFTIAGQKVSPSFNLTGIALISTALCADAVIGNVQEKTMRAYAATNSEMVLFSYAIGFVYILIGEIVTGELAPALTYCNENPKIYFLSFLFSLVGYIGILFVLSMVKSYGALLAVTVTTMRKALSIIMSFIFFTKPFTIQYVWSGLIVFSGIILSIYSKNRDRFNSFMSTRRSLCCIFVLLQFGVTLVLLGITFFT